MKLRNKLALAACSLMIVSGAAATTSVFAWYTAVRNTELKVNSIGAISQTGTLSVTYVDSTNITKKTTADTGDDITLESAKYLTDVSGDGSSDTFVKPMFDGTGSTNPTSTASTSSDIVGWWTEANYVAKYTDTIWYQKFTLNFAADSAAQLAVYLDPASTVTALNDDLLNSSNSVRFSISVGSNEVVYANPNATTADHKYWVANGTQATETIVTGLVEDMTDTHGKILEGTSFFGKSKKTTGDLTYGGTNPSYDDGYGYITTIAASGNQDVVFRVWIEGTDPECVNAGITDIDSQFKMSLKFYALETGLMKVGA
jgi:hypothetical protein